MNKPDIRPDHFKIVQDILNQHLASDVKVWVYGSRAKWTTLDSSDLDLALEGKGPVAYNVMSRLNIDFKNSDLPYEVDLRDMATVQPFFKNIINKDKILLDRFSPLKDAFIDITSLQKILILKLLKKYVPEWEVWVYGSRVKWSAKPSSDLDMVLFAKDEDQNKDQSKVDELRQAFKDSDLPFCVDLFVWSQIPERFHQEIKKDHVVLQRKAGNSRALPKGWKEVRLGDYCPFIYGKGLSKKDRVIGKVPIYGSGGIIGWHSTAYVQSHGIIIGRKGTVGSIYLSKKPFWPIDTVYYISKKNKLELYFTYYLLKSLPLPDMNSDSAVPGLNRENAHALKIAMPISVTDRNKIARILSSLDDKIELNRQINKTLERMAQAIFKSWFVDFDPVYAKKFALEAGRSQQQAEQATMAVIAGVCTPKESATQFKEMNAKLDEKLAKMSKGQVKHLTNTASLFPSDVKDSPLGPLPTTWSLKKLSDLSEIVGGGTPSTKIEEYYCDSETGVSWLAPKDLSGYSWKFISNGATDITELGLKRSSAKLLPKGTILISSRAPIGYVAIAEKELCTNQGFKSLIPQKSIGTNYLYNWTKLHIYKMDAIATGSVFKEISGTNMKSLNVQVPSKEIIDKFQSTVYQMTNYQNNVRYETKFLEKIRDTLLPKLLSGDINTSHIKNII